MYQKVKAFLAFQFTQPGAPQIYAGDEMGMWGSDDPHNRKPLIWPGIDFDDESGHPYGKERITDKVAFDAELHAFYQSLTQLRAQNPVLVDGKTDYYHADDDNKVLAYARTNEAGERIYVAFNMDFKVQPMPLPLGFMADTKVKLWQSDAPDIREFVTQQPISMRPFTASVVIIP